MRTLVVDDHELDARLLAHALAAGGYGQVTVCHDSRDVMKILRDQPVDVVLTDLTMPHVSGEDLLHAIGAEAPGVELVVVTAHDDVETAVRCVKHGAFDYLVKPVEPQRVWTTMKRIRTVRQLRDENLRLQHGLQSPVPEQPEAFAAIISREPSMLAVFRYLETVAATQHPVLLLGETGTGKELLARALHELSGRDGPFVVASLSGLSGEEAAAALFGSASASASATDLFGGGGWCAQARGGTLFLDEIGALDLATQALLMRMLPDEGEPEDGDGPNVRIVAASARDLGRLRDLERFRADLFYRLNGHRVLVPPLRERPTDLPLLLDAFLQEAAAGLGKEPPTPPEELVALLASYHFPGNVRELRAMVHGAVARHTSRKLSMAVFKQHIDQNRSDAPAHRPLTTVDGALVFPPRLPTLKEATSQLIDEALRRASGKQSIAARLLGISQSALSRRLKNRSFYDD